MRRVRSVLGEPEGEARGWEGTVGGGEEKRMLGCFEVLWFVKAVEVLGERRHGGQEQAMLKGDPALRHIPV